MGTKALELGIETNQIPFEIPVSLMFDDTAHRLRLALNTPRLKTTVGPRLIWQIDSDPGANVRAATCSSYDKPFVHARELPQGKQEIELWDPFHYKDVPLTLVIGGDGIESIHAGNRIVPVVVAGTDTNMQNPHYSDGLIVRPDAMFVFAMGQLDFTISWGPMNQLKTVPCEAVEFIRSPWSERTFHQKSLVADVLSRYPNLRMFQQDQHMHPGAFKYSLLRRPGVRPIIMLKPDNSFIDHTRSANNQLVVSTTKSWESLLISGDASGELFSGHREADGTISYVTQLTDAGYIIHLNRNARMVSADNPQSGVLVVLDAEAYVGTTRLYAVVIHDEELEREAPVLSLPDGDGHVEYGLD